MAEAGISPENQRSARVRLATALELARKRRHIPFNPVVDVDPPKTVDPVHIQPSELDLQRLNRAARGDPFEILPWLVFAAGPRRQEALGLLWEDVEYLAPDLARVTFRRRVNYGGKGVGRVERDGLKNGDPERSFYLRDLGLQALERRWQQQPADYSAHGHQKRWKGVAYAADQPTGYILTNPTDGAPLNPRMADEHFARIRDNAGLDQKRLHGLRRMFTSLMDKAGASERTTMEAAGHKRPEMTRYDQSPFESQLIDAATGVEAVLRQILGEATAAQVGSC
jgi:integrase